MIFRAMLCLVLLSLVFAPALVARDPQPTPLIRMIDPANGKAGDDVTVTGENLSKDVVIEVYLTDRTNKTKVSVDSQTATEIKFKVPGSIKPGKYWVMVLANMAEPLLIEEPVRIIIE